MTTVPCPVWATQMSSPTGLAADGYMDVVGWKCLEHISQTLRTQR